MRESNITTGEALQKAKDYCAREEKCRHQVRQKLNDWGADADSAEQILAQLMEEKYIDEERFAREFAVGKFRLNKWGKIKIAYELAHLHIPEHFIERGLEEIDPGEYEALLNKLMTVKKKSLKGCDRQSAIKKMATFALGKGFEAELVWPAARQLAVDG